MDLAILKKKKRLRGLKRRRDGRGRKKFSYSNQNQRSEVR
jgi:hypothetical protein